MLRSILLSLAVAWISTAAVFAAADVHDYGANGDGITDDTDAIRQAIAEGAVFFPRGIYRVTESIEINLEQHGPASLSGDGAARIVMAGKGPAFRFTGGHKGTADPKTVSAAVWKNQSSPRVSGLEIVGENPEADGIEASGTMQFTATGMVIRKVRHGIHLTGRNRNVLISDCHIYENSGCGVFLDHVNLHQTNITGSHISYNRGGGVVTRGGEVRNLHIGTCDIESNMGPDAPATANVLIDCTDGSTAEVSIAGCTIQHNSKSPDSANIRFIGRGITSTKDNTETKEGHLTITGNVLSDVMVNVHLQNVRGATITGNTFWEGFDHDLLIENSDTVVIGLNDFDRNPRYVVNGNWGKDRNGIVLRNCSDTKLEGLIVKGVSHHPAAVLLERCQRTTVQNCSILDNEGAALWLKDCARTVVSGCVLRDDRADRNPAASLKIEGGSENWITGNWLANGAEGLSEQELLQNRR